MSISAIAEPEEVKEPEVIKAPEPAKPKDEVLAAILNRIQPVTKVKKRLKVMVYSDPGAGKTTLLGGADNSLIVDVEDGLVSITNVPELMGSNIKAISYKTFTKGFESLETLIKKLHEAPPEFAEIETLSIDSVSELSKRGLAEVLEREWKRNPISNNRYAAETEHYTENNEHIRRLVSSLRDLDRNLILTAHARTIEPKVGPSRTFPDFSEKLANTLAGIVDIVAYMYIKEVEGEKKRIMRFHSNGNITAKTRIGGFPDEMENPTWTKLMEIVNNGKTEVDQD